MQTTIEATPLKWIVASEIPLRRLTLKICCVDCWPEVLPYGKWTCADGTEVLFNRGYHPIWRRRDGRTERVDPYWVERIVESEFFFDDFNSPWRGGKFGRDSFWDCAKALADFDVHVVARNSAPDWVRRVLCQS